MNKEYVRLKSLAADWTTCSMAFLFCESSCRVIFWSKQFGSSVDEERSFPCSYDNVMKAIVSLEHWLPHTRFLEEHTPTFPRHHPLWRRSSSKPNVLRISPRRLPFPAGPAIRICLFRFKNSRWIARRGMSSTIIWNTPLPQNWEITNTSSNNGYSSEFRGSSLIRMMHPSETSTASPLKNFSYIRNQTVTDNMSICYILRC